MVSGKENRPRNQYANKYSSFHRFPWEEVTLPFSVGLSTWMRVLGIMCGEGTESSGEREGESS